MFGKTKDKFQSEKTNFNPQSPYGAAKLAHIVTQNYRDVYGIFASNGILFNHESPIRGENFVTKKIVSSLCKIKLGYKRFNFRKSICKKRLGHAKDYAEAI